MSKMYQVFVTDEWNNNYLIGFYNNLDDCISEVNKFIDEEKFKLIPGDIKEYASTFGVCFDTSLYDILLSRDIYSEEELEDVSIYIRGFVLDKDTIMDTISKL